MVQLLCGWKAQVVVNMSVCVYKFNAAFLCNGEKKPISVTGHSLIQEEFPLSWKERQPLGVVITDAPLEESWWKSAQVLVASGSLP